MPNIMHLWTIVVVFMTNLGLSLEKFHSNNRRTTDPLQVLEVKSQRDDDIGDYWNKYKTEGGEEDTKNAYRLDAGAIEVTDVLSEEGDFERSEDILGTKRRNAKTKRSRKKKKMVERYKKSTNRKGKWNMAGQSTANAMAKKRGILERYRKSAGAWENRKIPGLSAANTMAEAKRVTHRYRKSAKEKGKKNLQSSASNTMAETQRIVILVGDDEDD